MRWLVPGLIVLLAAAIAAACGGGTTAPVRTATPAVTVAHTSPGPPLTQTAAPSRTSTPAPGATVAATAAPASPTADANPRGETGIEGVVLLGPTCPVQRIDSPCPDRPYAATIDIIDAGSGILAATVQSGADGRFRVLLPASSYRLVPRSSGTFPRGVEQTVTVAAGQIASVQVTYDTGIR